MRNSQTFDQARAGTGLDTFRQVILVHAQVTLMCSHLPKGAHTEGKTHQGSSPVDKMKEP